MTKPAGPPAGQPAPTPPPPADPAPTPPVDPNTPPADPEPFANERDRQRFAALTTTLNERERERDEARARLEQLRWREVERIASATLSVAADVRLEVADLAAVLADDGSVDAEKVAAAVAALVAARPGLKKPAGPSVLPGGHSPPPPPPAPTLADVFRRTGQVDR